MRFFKARPKALRSQAIPNETLKALGQDTAKLTTEEEGRARICIWLRRAGRSSIRELMKLLNQCNAGIRRHVGIIAESSHCTCSDGLCSWQEPQAPIIVTFLNLMENEIPLPT